VSSKVEVVLIDEEKAVCGKGHTLDKNCQTLFTNKLLIFGEESCAMCHVPRNTFRCKGKALPLQAWTGPEGSRKLRFPDFVTTAQDGGKVVSLTHRPPLPPGNTPGTYFC